MVGNKNLLKPPPWFAHDNYRFLNTLSLKQWGDLLREQCFALQLPVTPENRKRLIDARPRGSATYLDCPFPYANFYYQVQTIFTKFKRSIHGSCLEVERQVHVPRKTRKRMQSAFSFISNPPALYEIPSGRKLDLLEMEHRMGEIAVLVVDPHCPSGKLIELFKSWLETTARKVPDVVSRSGPKRLENRKYDSIHFVPWIDYKIVELSDLEIWYKQMGQAVTYEGLGHILYGGRADRNQYARKIRGEAFLGLRSLMSQARS